MNAVEYALVREVFHATRGLPPAAQTTILDERCEGRPDLRAEVESLLAWAERGEDDATPPALTLDPDGTPAIPTQVGAYRVLSLLGEGAAGVVYLAEQANPKRQVALKVLRGGFASPRAQRRFEHEAFLLGQLQHPNIAQVYTADAIATPQGPQPFFAMELVVGMPLTTFARARDLDVEERVALLATIADAVHHAHLRGVIHCDLKPANILVAADGTPKVLDFGIARALDPAASGTLTGDRALAGTVAYMSPEQTAGDASRLDVRSDVYALGVVAYELLASRLPYDLPDRDLLAALQVVREAEPVPLARLAPACRGDLSLVVAKALTKDRAARYASAGDFAADLRRCLRHLPIEARAPSAWYRLAKFARRRRGWLAAATLALAAATTGVVSTVVGAAQTQRAAQLTARGNEFLKRALLDLDPRRVGGEVKLADVLRRIDTELETAFADEPRLAVEMRCAVAGAMGTVGLLVEAERSLRRAADLATQELGPADALTLEARAAYGSALEAIGRYAEAEATVRDVLATHAAGADAGDGSALGAEHDLVCILAARGKHRDALAAAERVVAGYVRLGGDDDPRAWRSRESLATEMLEVGDTAAGLLQMRAVVAHHRTKLGPEHPDLLGAVVNLASLLHDAGELREARDLLDATVPTLSKVLGPSSPAVLLARNHVARVVGALGERTQAVALYETLITDCEAALGRRHPDTLLRRNNLGALLNETGKLDEAAALYEDVIAAGVEQLGADHPAVVLARHNLAAALMRSDAPRSEQLFREVLAWRRKELGDEHPDTTRTLGALALLLQNMNRPADAWPLQSEATERSKRVLGDDHPDTLTAINNLAGLLVDLGRYPEAETAYRDLLTRLRTVLGDEHPVLFTAQNNIANVLRASGDAAGAAREYVEALAMGRRMDGVDEHALLSTIATYAFVLIGLGELDTATPLVEEALGRRRARGETAYVGMLLGFQGDIHARAGRAEASLASYAAGIEALTPGLPRSARAIVELTEKESAALTAAGETARAEARLLHVHALLSTGAGRSATGARNVAKLLADFYGAQGNAGKAAEFTGLAGAPK